ncbi:phage integrase family protein [uncultured Azohydromonas sp.]|uniref:phage integrase family protein n=1 Tax=uncultured Azohydromonas sp. TaxID=487342 RepID=UPI00262FE95D|nr:phage integrase family protein [uncultured Azohydromonas sp.]
MTAPLVAPRRGRPRGSRTEVTSSQALLRLHHFSFLRALAEGVSLRAAWERYMAFAGGPDDERHFAAQARRLRRQIAQAARAHGLDEVAAEALAEPAAATADAGMPSLQDWIAQSCEAGGFHPEDRDPAEWLREYQAEFGLDAAVLPQPATAGLAPRPVRLGALNRLATALSAPPSLEDALALWLTPTLSAALRGAGLLTLRDLADFANAHGARWHRRVPGVGTVRAGRLLDWLRPLAESLGHPLREAALQPARQLALARERALVAVQDRRLGIVPLERLAVPPDLDGRHGVFRLATPNVLGASTDLEALRAWLQRYAMSPRTHASYAREAERFYLWCLCVRRKPLSSVQEEDLHAYRGFIANPPGDWLQPRQEGRDSEHWRPFRGPLSPLSQRHALTVIASMLGALMKAGYLGANAAAGVAPHLKLPRPGIDVRRSFDEAQWRWLMSCWEALYREAGAPGGLADLGPDAKPARARSLRRLRLVLELGATTGLRLIELCTARLSGLRRERFEGESVWMLEVLGKGHRRRSVPIYDDIKALIDRHQADMEAAGVGHEPAAPLRTLLTPAGTGGMPVDGADAPWPGMESDSTHVRGGAPRAQRPLIGALRGAVPRWRLDAQGVPTLEPGRQADRWGALEPSALYQSLKRLLRHAGERAHKAQPPLDGDAFRGASTHWLRHFFANNAAADGVLPVALMGAMGHADLKTTSLYTRPEQQLMLRELAKVRRRGGG